MSNTEKVERLTEIVNFLEKGKGCITMIFDPLTTDREEGYYLGLLDALLSDCKNGITTVVESLKNVDKCDGTTSYVCNDEEYINLIKL